MQKIDAKDLARYIVAERHGKDMEEIPEFKELEEDMKMTYKKKIGHDIKFEHEDINSVCRTVKPEDVMIVKNPEDILADVDIKPEIGYRNLDQMVYIEAKPVKEVDGVYHRFINGKIEEQHRVRADILSWVTQLPVQLYGIYSKSGYDNISIFLTDTSNIHTKVQQRAIEFYELELKDSID